MTSSKRMMATAVVLATCTACTSALAESPRQFSGVAAFYSTNYSGRTAAAKAMTRKNIPLRTAVSHSVRVYGSPIRDRSGAS